ncbi:hypothetical protein [Neisseria yangbaofengii]|uniref:hypothetical protein n=1 Tax=Neisseria yangbaofengii TaxID=2709396 RepID=UPI001F14D9E7|nr:hypothetical protein [Neisseria yangbaofengii]
MKSLILWLSLFAAVFAFFQYQQPPKIESEQLMQASAPQDRSAVAGLDGLGYLNFLRKTGGFAALGAFGNFGATCPQSCAVFDRESRRRP